MRTHGKLLNKNILASTLTQEKVDTLLGGLTEKFDTFCHSDDVDKRAFEFMRKVANAIDYELYLNNFNVLLYSKMCDNAENKWHAIIETSTLLCFTNGTSTITFVVRDGDCEVRFTNVPSLPTSVLDLIKQRPLMVAFD